MNQEEENFQNAKRRYLDQLNEGYMYSVSKFDQQALYISSGALALSIGFVKDFVPIDKAKCLLLFSISIGLFTITVLFSFIGHYISYLKIEKAIDVIENDRQEDFENSKLPQLINLWTMVSLLLGIISLVTFFSINVYHYKEIKKESTVIITATILQISETKPHEIKM